MTLVSYTKLCYYIKVLADVAEWQTHRTQNAAENIRTGSSPVIGIIIKSSKGYPLELFFV